MSDGREAPAGRLSEPGSAPSARSTGTRDGSEVVGSDPDGPGPSSAPDPGDSEVEGLSSHESSSAEPGAPRDVSGPEATAEGTVWGEDARSEVVVDVLSADVGALIAERDEYLDALQRVKADFDNYRKRVLRQQEEQTARAARDLVTKLLPVLDTLDLAEAHLGSDRGDASPHEATALAQARAQLIDVLAREGLERVDETEVAFDPLVHDAVAHAPDEGSEGAETLIDEVLRSGYRWHGHVLRPAMVRVRG